MATRKIILALPVVCSALVVLFALWNVERTNEWSGYYIFDKSYAGILALLLAGIAVWLLIESLVLLYCLRKLPNTWQLAAVAAILLPLILLAAIIVTWCQGAYSVVTK